MRPRHPGSPRALATFSAGPGPRSLSLFLGGEAPHPLVFLRLTRPILGASPSAAKLRCCHPTSPPGSPGHPTPSLAESRSRGRDSSAALFSVLQHLSEQQRRPGQVTLTLCPSAGSGHRAGGILSTLCSKEKRGTLSFISVQSHLVTFTGAAWLAGGAEAPTETRPCSLASTPRLKKNDLQTGCPGFYPVPGVEVAVRVGGVGRGMNRGEEETLEPAGLSRGWCRGLRSLRSLTHSFTHSFIHSH